MRRFLHGLLVGVLTLWIPLDSAVAGWWLHHHPHHAPPVLWGPAPLCGGPPLALGPGWVGAVVIDDRPLFAAPVVWVEERPVILAAAPITEWAVAQSHDWVVTGEWVVTDTPVEHHEPRDCACDPCGGEVIVAERVVGEGWQTDGATVVDSTPIEVQAPGVAPTTDAAIDSEPTSVIRIDSIAEPAAPLELPSASTAPLTTPDTESKPTSILESFEPKMVQGETAENVESTPEPDAVTTVPATTEADAAAFETPAVDEQIEDAQAPPAVERRRNLFDEVPADEADAFEAPRGSDIDGPPADAFEAPADQGFESPADDPLDEAPMTDEPAAGDDGFESPVDEVMEEAPADEPAVEEPATEEAPAEADPFDSSALPTPGQPSRQWQDDTGRHSTQGRLVEVRTNSVRILKITGRYTTVPMSRLSAADRDHVAAIALAARRPADRAGDTAGL